MQPPPTVPATAPSWKKSIFAPRCCGVEPRVCATVATTTRSPRSPASLIRRYRSRCGIVGIRGSYFVLCDFAFTVYVAQKVAYLIGFLCWLSVYLCGLRVEINVKRRASGDTQRTAEKTLPRLTF